MARRTIVKVTIGIAVPTIGRDSLTQTLDALAPQVEPGDQIWVVQDTHAAPDVDVKTRVDPYGPCFRYHAHDAGRSFNGVFQTNEAFMRMTTDLALSHSDDDVFAPTALPRIRELAASSPDPRPILFRCCSPNGRMTWPDGRQRLRRHRLGGGSLAAPRRFLVPYHYPCEGIDYYWVCEILALAAAAGHLPIWTDDVLMYGRGMKPA